MKSISIGLRAFVVGIAAVLLLASGAGAAEVRVMISGGLTAAYKALVPDFERTTGHKVITAYGPSMGTTVNAIPVRLERGEPADVLIMVGYALGDLAKQGKVIAGSSVDLVKSPIGMAVKSGAPKPDISSVDALKRTLLAAKSIVYSDPAKGGASGVYFAHVVEQLGIADQLKSRTILVPGAQAGDVVAKGEAEIGVGQASEIVPVAGAQLVGPLPGEFASVTAFSAAIGAGTKSAEAAKSLILFLTGPSAAPVLKSKGFQPG